jgi:hypothetical protein
MWYNNTVVYFKSNLKRRLKMEVNENLYYLIRFIAEFKRAPKSREIYEGRCVGQYFNNIKRGTTTISPSDVQFFKRSGINICIENRQAKVHEKFLILVEFMEKNKRKPNYKDVYKGIALYHFMHNLITGNTALNPQDKKKFESVLKSVSK